MRPSSGFSIPAMHLSVMLLPQPEAPSSEVTPSSAVEGHVEAESAELFSDIDEQTHAFTAFFCRASSMFTVSSTTVLMARFTITQKKAPASSLVRQSW